MSFYETWYNNLLQDIKQNNWNVWRIRHHVQVCLASLGPWAILLPCKRQNTEHSGKVTALLDIIEQLPFSEGEKTVLLSYDKILQSKLRGKTMQEVTSLLRLVASPPTWNSPTRYQTAA